jgi:hypothetical protein
MRVPPWFIAALVVATTILGVYVTAGDDSDYLGAALICGGLVLGALAFFQMDRRR